MEEQVSRGDVVTGLARTVIRSSVGFWIGDASRTALAKPVAHADGRVDLEEHTGHRVSDAMSTLVVGMAPNKRQTGTDSRITVTPRDRLAIRWSDGDLIRIVTMRRLPSNFVVCYHPGSKIRFEEGPGVLPDQCVPLS